MGKQTNNENLGRAKIVMFNQESIGLFEGNNNDNYSAQGLDFCRECTQITKIKLKQNKYDYLYLPKLYKHIRAPQTSSADNKIPSLILSNMTMISLGQHGIMNAHN